ncbi:MAG TPA: M13-type metalloendopeptidase [Thermoanaerobaculia bacterium]|nr:M13-type metalloendopeptidase [Thermoanaerobaculia bacterium]
MTRRFCWLLAAVTAVFAITLVFKPLAPSALLTNPLFAIGFGAPLVLHLSSLPNWKDVVATAAIGVALSLLIGNWIIGLGLASTIVLGIRRDWLFLLPSLITLVFTLEVSLFLDIISTYPRITFDHNAYAADLAFGAPVSFRVGEWFVAWPIFGAICTFIYLAPPPGLIFVYALQAKAKEQPRIDIVTTLLAMGAAGYSLYFLVPACGPKYAFPNFPNGGFVLLPKLAPRNAIPSLHLASALIAFIHARRFGRIASAVAMIFLIGTIFGTLGTGEHYLVDLIVAVPFTIAMHAILERRFTHAIAPALIFFAWLWLLRFHAFAPWLAWTMTGLALASALPVNTLRFARMKKPLIALLLFAIACSTNPTPKTTPPPKPLFGEHGFDVTQIDTSVTACDDFYNYAVGNWRKRTPLPAKYSRYGRFEELADRNRLTLRAILEESSRANAEKGSATQKIGDYWSSCTNEAQIEQQGITPIAGDLARIDAINDRKAVVDEIDRLHQKGIPTLFRLGAQNDFKNSKEIIAAITQGGLGLPDRDYYLTDRFADTRKKYVDHIAKMFELAGIDSGRAGADAERVMALETRIAKVSMARIEQRNPENIYHITTIAQLDEMAPLFAFPQFIQSAGLSDLKTLNVAQPEFFKETNRLLDEVALESWKSYLRWKVLDAAAPYLSSKFVMEDFEFSGRALSGQKEIKERWERCVASAEQNIGQLTGQEYVKRAFSPEAKRKMNDLIGNLIAALREDIPQLSWMGPETKAEALKKLDAFTRRIGYPDKWIDYASLDLTRDSYAGNVLAARAFQFRRSVSRIGKPDDPNEWGFFTPATVNAGYNPPRNDITFPAGILQPPFYDPNADDAYNYGGIGMVIGHEMSHGFDDQGAKFDGEGNLRNWWTDEDLKNFQSRAECIANQYSEFVVEPGLNIQGKLVTGEAIGDLGGVTLALRAYEKSLEGKERKVIDGFTPEQRFFLAFAQVWGENMAPEEAKRRAITDPHAQGPFRVNATVANMPEFATAFGCAASARMVREAGKKCSIW